MPSEQADVPIKNLLKQVYAVHTTKVKCLEDEIEELKNKLCEAEKKLKVQDSDCKRCAELEEAFTSCKAALEEQTKWFENFGQKFSIFSSSENKISSKTSKLQNDIMQIHNESSFGSDFPQSNETKEKSSITKNTLLKNLMSLTPDKVQDSLDLCTLQFPGNLGPSYSSLNFDSVILAPDTADVILDVQNNVHKQSRTKLRVLKGPEQLNDATDQSKDYTKTNNLRKKRTSSDSSESCKSPQKKFKGLKDDFSSENKPAEKEIVKKKESVVEKHIQLDIAENLIGKQQDNKAINFKTSKNNTPLNMDNNKGKGPSMFDLEISKDTNAEDSIKVPSVEKEKKCHTKLEQVTKKDSIYGVSSTAMPLNKLNEKPILQEQPKLAEDPSVEKGKKCQTKLEHTISKDSMFQVSPSIIPPKKNEIAILQKQPMIAEDISDFQVPTINKNPPEMVDVRKTSDKRKTKKGSNIKGVKMTSKFKMSLDALPPNYKKPNLRQTKLSKSIFQPKNPTPEGSFSKILSDSSNSFGESSKKKSPAIKSNQTNTVDFDATCIPENYKYIAESGDDDDEESILLIQDESSDESLHSLDVSLKTKDKSITQEDVSKENIEKDMFEDFLPSKKPVTSENLNSFDRLPKREEPNYKYKEETVRKKSERKQLNGFECKECEKYFADLGLPEEEKQKRLNKCSRHRSKFAPPSTPEHFWELDFPDTQECKARGYLNETQKATLKTHRRRPL